MTDPRLLVPATLALLDGWCGPVVTRAMRNAGVDDGAAAFGCRPNGRAVPMVRVRGWSDDWYALGDVFLDLARDEAADRCARVLAERMGIPVGATAPDWSRRFDLPHWTLAGPQRGNGGGPSLTFAPGQGGVEALADLDPSDDTRLPSSGARLVDRLALAAVVREVLCGR